MGYTRNNNTRTDSGFTLTRLKMVTPPEISGWALKRVSEWAPTLAKKSLVAIPVLTLLLGVGNYVGLPSGCPCIMGVFEQLTTLSFGCIFGYVAWQVSGYFGLHDQIEVAKTETLRFEYLENLVEVQSKGKRKNEEIRVETLDGDFRAKLSRDAEAENLIRKKGWLKISLIGAKKGFSGDEILGIHPFQANPTLFKRLYVVKRNWSLAERGAYREVDQFDFFGNHEVNTQGIDYKTFRIGRKNLVTPQPGGVYLAPAPVIKSVKAPERIETPVLRNGIPVSSQD